MYRLQSCQILAGVIYFHLALHAVGGEEDLRRNLELVLTPWGAPQSLDLCCMWNNK